MTKGYITNRYLLTITTAAVATNISNVNLKISENGNRFELMVLLSQLLIRFIFANRHTFSEWSMEHILTTKCNEACKSHHHHHQCTKLTQFHWFKCIFVKMICCQFMAYWILIPIQNRSILATKSNQANIEYIDIKSNSKYPNTKFGRWNVVTHCKIFDMILYSDRSMWAVNRNVRICEIG